MHIWYFHPYGNAPGRGKYLRPFYLAREWQSAGHTATCFVSRNHHLLDKPEPLPSDEVVEGVRFVALAARPYAGNGVSRALNMLEFCRSMLTVPRELPRPDVVITSSPHPFSIFPAYWLARKHKAKLVFEVRDIWPLSVIEMTKTPRWHPITIGSWLAEHFAYRKSGLVASLLGNAEGYMRGRGLKGAFVHVPNGISPGDDLAANPATPDGRRAAEVIMKWRQEGRTIVIHPGTQGSPSALDALLEAVALLPHSKLGVLLVGGGDHSGELPALATRLGLEDIVEFIPPVPKSEALWLTANSDIGYAGKRNFQTVFQHGISFNKIADYMQVGLPIILPVTTAGDPISQSGCGVVTGDKPADIALGLEKLLSMSPAARRQMGERGRQYAATNLAYPAIARKYIKAIMAV